MRRVLVTGMGTELGARVAQLLEDETGVEAIAGFDTDPPRLRLRQAEFHRVDARDRERVAKLVNEFAPDTLLHMGVFEPGARWPSPIAERRTLAGTRAVFDAAVDAASVERIVVRSGIEVYGPPGRVEPDARTPTHPTTSFARTLVRVEEAASAAGKTLGARVTTLRLAPVVAAHGPSPLARYLRLPVVPIPGLGLARFALLHPEDAAAAVVAAGSSAAGIVNVVAPGTMSVLGAVRAGNRIPLPVLGPSWAPGWLVARRVTEAVGAPLPDHVLELLRRGRRAKGQAARRHTTPEIIAAIHAWSP